MWDTIKRILRKGGGRYIIVEEDQPRYVVMTMDEYEELLDKMKYFSSATEPTSEPIEEVNKDISEWHDQAKTQLPVQPQVVEPQREEVRVEDLPF